MKIYITNIMWVALVQLTENIMLPTSTYDKYDSLKDSNLIKQYESVKTFYMKGNYYNVIIRYNS